MQQTEHLKLNIIEGGDPVDWEVMNENAEKLEAAVTQTQTELSKGLAAVAESIGSGGQTCRIAWGSYTGNGKYGSGNPNSLTFDFTPVLVVIGSAETTYSVAWPTVIIRGANSGHADSSAEKIQVTWTANGVQWYSDKNQSYQNNYSGYAYYYAALGYSAE